MRRPLHPSVREAILSLVPGLVVFAAVLLLEPDAHATGIIAGIGAVAMLAGFAWKVEKDSRLLGILLRRRHPLIPNRPRDLAAQAALLALAAGFGATCIRLL